MPNWTSNTISMNGIDKKDLFSVDEWGELNFDFDKIIPQPKTKEECPLKYIDDGKMSLEHTEDDKWFNWYDWRYDNWGVKWNACETQIEEGIVRFSTPWYKPEPIAIALSKMFPNEEIIWEHNDEDYSGDYTTYYLNGEIIKADCEIDEDWYKAVHCIV